MITEAEIIKLIEEGQEGPKLDFKQDLPLESDGDKAEFVKDIIALANSGGTAHIIIGVEDGTWKPVGISTHHTAEQLNQILKDKTDPPLRVEYAEKDILHYKIGVIEVKGDNPPYIVAVPDRFGGPLSATPQKQFFIERGTVFIRNFNINEGARRTDLDQMYAAKYVVPQADLQLSHEVVQKPVDGFTEVEIKFTLTNRGKVPAVDPFLLVHLENIEEIINCTGNWEDISRLYENLPTIRLAVARPVYVWIAMRCDGAVVKVKTGVKQIRASIDLQAVNMSRKSGRYDIDLEKQQD